jgi:agmatine/peptidylarginine deiminase
MLQMANVNLEGSLYNPKTNRSWMRDSGPIVKNGEQRRL